MAETQTLLDSHGLEPREEITSDNVELIFGYILSLLLNLLNFRYSLDELYKLAMKYYKVHLILRRNRLHIFLGQ